MERPVLSSVDVVTSDMEASIAFYRRLGLEVKPWPEDTEPHHATIPMPGGAELMLNSTRLARNYDRSSAAGGRAYLIFSLPSREAVDELHTELTGAGHTSIEAPFDAFWGARYAIVADPDGIPVGIMSPSDQEHQHPPGLD